MSQFEAEGAEGYITGGITPNGYTAEFEWYMPDDAEFNTREFVFTIATRKGYYPAGIISVHTGKRMGGLPRRVDMLKVDALTEKKDIVNLSNILGSMAVKLIIISSQTDGILSNERTIVLPEESQIMIARERIFSRNMHKA